MKLLDQILKVKFIEEQSKPQNKISNIFFLLEKLFQERNQKK